MRALLLFMLYLTSHCGYNWGHQTRDLPGGHKTVYIEMFKNQTQQIGLESYFTRAMTQELERSGFAIVTNRSSAEIIIKGDVIGAAVTGAGSDSSFVSKDYSAATPTATRYNASFFTAYRVTVTTNLRAIRSRDKQLIWQTTLSGGKSYQSARLKQDGLRSSNVLYNQARKKQTMKLIAKEMMSDAFDRLTENF